MTVDSQLIFSLLLIHNPKIVGNPCSNTINALVIDLHSITDIIKD